MPRRFLSFSLLAASIFSVAEARAQQQLPPPRAMPAVYQPLRGVLPPAGRPVPTLPLAALPYPVPGYRPSAYQVWQNYGVNRSGWIVPRIWQIDNRGYWRYNGAPFPYVDTMPGRHFPAVGPAGLP